MKNILIVDGYNIINSWEDLSEIKKISLEASRDKLIDIMANYAGYLKYKVIIVFDGQNIKGAEEKIIYSTGVEVIYPKPGETADDVIEKMVFSIGHDKDTNVFVATSDWAEQTMIFAKGALRISAPELKKQIEKVNQEIKVKINNKFSNWRIDNCISDDVLEKLERLRRK